MAIEQAKINHQNIDKQLCDFLDGLIKERLIELNIRAKTNPEPLIMNADGLGTIKIGLGGGDLEISIQSLIERGRVWGYDVAQWESDYDRALKGSYNP